MMSSKSNHHLSNNMSLTTRSVDNSVDYAGHLYDSTKIRTDDFPILTDQFAPIENLLNPITDTEYNLEQKQITTNTKVDSYSIEGTMFTFVLPMLIAFIWIFYMQINWRKGRVLILEPLIRIVQLTMIYWMLIILL
jgi:hypothetical protein